MNTSTCSKPKIIATMSGLLCSLLLSTQPSQATALDAAFVANFNENSISVISRDSLSTLASLPVGTHPLRICSTQNGRWIFVSNNGSASVSVIDPQLQQVVATIPVGNQPDGLAVSTDDSTLYVVNGSSSTLSVIDIDSRQVTRTITLAKEPTAVAVHPHRPEIWIGYNTTAITLEVRSTTDFSVLASLRSGNIMPASGGIAFSPDGSQVWGAENCGCCGRFHLLSGELVDGKIQVIQSNIYYDNKGAAYAVAVDPLTSKSYFAKSGHCNGVPIVYEQGTQRSIPLQNPPRFMVIDSSRKQLWITTLNGKTLIADTDHLNTLASLNVSTRAEGMAFAPWGKNEESADLAVLQSFSQNPVTLGQSTLLKLTITNAGPSIAHDIQIANQLPANLKLKPAPNGPWSISSSTDNIINASIHTLPPASSETIILELATITEGHGTNAVQVSSPVPDPNPENNTSYSQRISVDPEYTNLALNPSASGLPSPLESSPGWGSGSNPWEIIDGKTSYNFWTHGLAFTGGHTDHNNPESGGYIQPAGPRQATINLGKTCTVEKVVIWQHGDEHTPAQPKIETWDGQKWSSVAYTRNYSRMFDPGQSSGSAWSDEFYFTPVATSKVRYSFDNREQNIVGSWNIHGWIYEFQVLGRINTAGKFNSPTETSRWMPGRTNLISWSASCPLNSEWSVSLKNPTQTLNLNLQTKLNGEGVWQSSWVIPCNIEAGSYTLVAQNLGSGITVTSEPFKIGTFLTMGFCVTWYDTECSQALILEQADSIDGPWSPVEGTPFQSGEQKGIFMPSDSKMKLLRLR